MSDMSDMSDCFVTPMPEGEYVTPYERERDLHEDLRQVINKHSVENGSDTSDSILAFYLIDCLKVWNTTTRRRDRSNTRPPDLPQPAAPTMDLLEGYPFP